ncbi:MAG: cation diffusion facilitator family transporter [Alphaproteobacteria bacterium]|nr:cation diffusion facilitator family transporter [Alphaproteobacteria bacterium]
MSKDATTTAHGNLRRYATYASVAVAMTLILAKLAAYVLTDSVAMLSSMIDSMVDLVASLVAAYGVARALRPPSREYRFGHGKAEPLAALMQAAFIVGSAILLAVEALGRLYQPRAIENTGIGYAVVVFAIVLTLALLLFQRYVIHRTKSLAISADRLHYSGDVLINLAVGATYALESYTKQIWLDPLFALVIGGILLVGAYKICRKALSVLMDRELPEADRTRISSVAMMQEGVRGLHDLRTRSDSGRAFIELHLEVDPEITVRAAHDIAENVMEKINRVFPNADVLVHQDPLGVEEKRLDEEIEDNNPVLAVKDKP